MSSSSPLRQDVLVLGAGMVGVCTALQLARRGHRVALVDRRGPGEETSSGNAGIVQREAVVPYAFPRDWPSLRDAALGRSPAVHYHLRALPALAGPLWRYWRASAPARHARSAVAHSALIRHSLQEHLALADEAGARHLLRPGGYHAVFRTAPAWQAAAAEARRLADAHGLSLTVRDGAALAQAEPGLQARLAGALHWQDPFCCPDPGALVRAYAARLPALGGVLLRGDAQTLAPQGQGWQVQTEAGPVQAARAVLALGPWIAPLAQRLGYRLPLFAKRGYHRHFRQAPALSGPVLDAERGLVLAPMAQGLRLTTGAEFARLDAPPTLVQVARATAAARELLPLDDPREAEPWLGRRPCTPDMLPLIGPAPRHPGLWFHGGHAHQGFTLGPVSARLLAELMEGGTPGLGVDPTPYAPQRFL
ncbi:NAD(P)/FAD-dependent oxidoreductase [Ideonella livida]|uniref:FAD-binding oxidoreductase n=1 Tax=Ideonella livida TaxID=2707176 RepID=A0A7C9PJ67_9BURK|nr:FAD-dependent oxidoreductase [Ideonella livida]NDY92514.1 FAD-binding oxidoreductase [Ideonella livida]